jgi:hypothetical protein
MLEIITGALSTKGLFALLGSILGAIALLLGNGAVRRRRVALAAYHAYQMVEDVAAECRAAGKDFPYLNKAAAGLKYADEWMRANGWRPLKPGEKDLAQLTFKSLHGEKKAAEPHGAAGLLLLLLTLPVSAMVLTGCAAGPVGPRRASLSEALEAPEPVEAQDAPAASPFAAGLMVGVGVPLEGGPVLPAQLAAGSLKLDSLGERSINLMAFGGLSGTSVAEARAAWGGGLGFEITPGNLLYEVNVTAGPLWVSGMNGPFVLLGFAIHPKM